MKSYATLCLVLEPVQVLSVQSQADLWTSHLGVDVLKTYLKSNMQRSGASMSRVVEGFEK